MKQSDLENYCRRLQLSKAGAAYLGGVVSQEPTRRVASHGGNRIVRYPSRKNGFVVQAESSTVELPYIYSLEFDDTVQGYYDQPTTISLSYVAKSGRRTGARHTPDFLVLREDGVEIVECKSEEELIKCGEEMPNRYQKDSDNQWVCPPGEAAVREFGFRYKVVNSTDMSPVFVRNITFLADFFDARAPELDPKLSSRVLEVIRKRAGISIQELMDLLPEIKAEDVYTLIGQRQAFVDLDQGSVVDWQSAIIFSSPEMARTCRVLARITPRNICTENIGVLVAVGSELLWHDRLYVVANYNTSAVVLTADERTIQIERETFDAAVADGEIIQSGGVLPMTDPKVVETALAATPEELSEAHRRHKAVKCGSPETAGVTQRTIERWTKDYREADAVYGCGFLGLIPKVRQKGNRTKRFPDAVYDLAIRVIKEDYLTFKQKRCLPVYARFREECTQIGQVPPSYQWFCDRIRALNRYQTAKNRNGRRGAYGVEPRTELTGALRTCDRPFERVHVDHTQLDLQLISSTTGKPIHRPWLTLAIDEKTRRVLAYYVTFDSPSYKSCMAILRELVRLHNRFPHCLVVDNGKEFSSCDFEMLAARYEMAIEKRPPAKARFGSVIERMFGTINTQLLYQLWGNTQATKTGMRKVTKSNDPTRLACWTLTEFDRILSDYLSRVYDVTSHPALGMSPAEAFVQAMSDTGHRPSRIIGYDESFIVWCLPSTRTGLAKVQPRNGVKVNHIYYWSDSFHSTGVEGSKVRVKIDPFNAGIVYAMVNGRWQKCVSQYHHFFNGRSLREVQIATEELRRSKAGITSNRLISAKRLLDFMGGPEELERLKQQREYDNERRIAARKIESYVGAETVTPIRTNSFSATEERELSGKSPQLENIEEVYEI